MGKKHAQAQAAQARATADEAIREAENRRRSAEEERQLLTSYLGTEDQVNGTGQFNVDPNVLRFTQRFSLDERALAEIAGAGAGVKNQGDPFQMAGAVERGQQYVSQANDLLAQSEAAARSGNFELADQLYQQATSIISGVTGPAAEAFNLVGNASSSAAIRASSTEGRIVGRQLLTARELGDPNSATSTSLRGRLLDPALMAIDENTRNAERAIAAERGEIEGQIRQQGAAGGTGVNARAQLALQSRAASQAALQRAITYSEAGQAKAAITAQVNLYFNEFAKRMAEDAVRLAQDWVNGSAGIRDTYQDSLTQLNIIEAQIQEDRARMFQTLAEKRRDEKKARESYINEGIFGLFSGLGAGSLIFGSVGGGQIGKSSGLGQGGGFSAGTGSTLGSVGTPGGASTRVDENFAPGAGEAADVGAGLSSGGGGGGGLFGGGGGGLVGSVLGLFL